MIADGRESPTPCQASGRLLAVDTVLVVAVRLDRDESDVTAALASLDEGERARAERFLRPDARRRHVLSHAALRALLAVHASADHASADCASADCASADRAASGPAALRIRADLRGKPRIDAGPAGAGLQFNLAHAGDLALIALASGREVGVDLEALRPLPDAARLGRRIFAPAEATAWEALPQDQRTAALLRCWTRKEALLKASGLGLRMPLADLDLGWQALPPEGRRVPDPTAGAPPWRLLDLDLPAGWVGSLAVQDVPGSGIPRVILTPRSERGRMPG